MLPCKHLKAVRASSLLRLSDSGQAGCSWISLFYFLCVSSRLDEVKRVLDTVMSVKLEIDGDDDECY